MTESPESRIRTLRAGVDQRLQDRARAEVELAAAQSRERVALKALSDEFGVPGLAEAAGLLKVKEADLEQACTAAEAALREAGG